MKKTVAIMAGMALSSGIAFAAQEQGTQDYDPERDVVTETERDRGTGMETPPETTDPYGAETTDPYGTQTESQRETTAGTTGDRAGKDLSQKSSDELSGKSVVSATGEEVGEIDEVGYSSTHQDRVAVVEVGGFLGVGERRIAIPLSELQMGKEDTVMTSLTRESIEAQEEFDEAGFTADQ